MHRPDIFQERVSTLFQEIDYVRAYIDDVLCLTSADWDDHLQKLEPVLEKLQQTGLKVNAGKSTFGASQVEYLGYILTREGLKYVEKKISAIMKIKAPETIKQLRSFIDMINYYRDFWIRRSHVLTPLTKLTSTKQN